MLFYVKKNLFDIGGVIYLRRLMREKVA